MNINNLNFPHFDHLCNLFIVPPLKSFDPLLQIFIADFLNPVQNKSFTVIKEESFMLILYS